MGGGKKKTEAKIHYIPGFESFFREASSALLERVKTPRGELYTQEMTPFERSIYEGIGRLTLGGGMTPVDRLVQGVLGGRLGLPVSYFLSSLPSMRRPSPNIPDYSGLFAYSEKPFTPTPPVEKEKESALELDDITKLMKQMYELQTKWQNVLEKELGNVAFYPPARQERVISSVLEKYGIPEWFALPWIEQQKAETYENWW